MTSNLTARLLEGEFGELIPDETEQLDALEVQLEDEGFFDSEEFTRGQLAAAIADAISFPNWTVRGYASTENRLRTGGMDEQIKDGGSCRRQDDSGASG